MRIAAPSMRAQTIAILVIGLLVSHLAGVYIYALERRSALAETESFDVVERAASVIALLRNVPEDWRAEVMNAADSRSFRVWRTERPILAGAAASDDDAALLAYLRELLPGLASRDMQVAAHVAPPPGAAPPERAEAAGPRAPGAFEAAAGVVTISIHHPEGFWINFMGAVARPASPLPGFLAAYTVALAFAVAIVGFWLVDRVTRPLADFADAAERLGRDLRAMPLEARGPREVAIARRAFNRMQERISRLIENRVELLAAISHDLRTPITRLKLRAEDIADAEERERFMSTLDEMEAIISTFLDYARSSFGSEPRALVELSSLVESVCSDFADGGGDVSFADAAPVHVECKRIAIKRAVANLIDNALKYGESARVSLIAGDSAIEIRVDDRGPGIAVSEMEKALAPFHRGEPSRSKETGGAGLGLSIATAVAHDHGGDLVLANLPEGGLSARLLLPG